MVVFCLNPPDTGGFLPGSGGGALVHDNPIVNKERELILGRIEEILLWLDKLDTAADLLVHLREAFRSPGRPVIFPRPCQLRIALQALCRLRAQLNSLLYHTRQKLARLNGTGVVEVTEEVAFCWTGGGGGSEVLRPAGNDLVEQWPHFGAALLSPSAAGFSASLSSSARVCQDP